MAGGALLKVVKETLTSKPTSRRRIHEFTWGRVILLAVARLSLGTFSVQGVIAYFGILYGTIIRATRSRLFAIVLRRWA